MEPSSSSHESDPSRHPDSSLQRNSLSSQFAKLRLSSPSSINPSAISLSLNSASLSIADQASRELCRLVSDSLITPSTALLELQSALDGCSGTDNARVSLAPIFVKAIGFIVRFLFRADPTWGESGFEPVELHPFIKVLLCGEHVETELIRQVSLFIVHNRTAQIVAAVRFLKPFVIFAILKKNYSIFVRDLISSLASISCSLDEESIFVLRLLTGCLKYFPHESQKEIKLMLSSAEYILDAHVVILKQTYSSKLSQGNIKACSWVLLETILSLCYLQNKHFGVTEIIFQLAKHLLSVQKELNFKFLPEFNSIFIIISYVLSQTEFEHEQISALKLLIFLTEWKIDTELNESSGFREGLICLFPIVNLLMSPSKSVKAMASHFISRVNGFITDLMLSSRDKKSLNWTPPVGTRSSLVSKLLNQVLFEGQLGASSCFYLEFIFRNDISDYKEKPWQLLLKEYFIILGIPNNNTPNLPNQAIIQSGISGLLSSIISILIPNPKLGESSIETLNALGALDQKKAMPLLLNVLFYIKTLSNNDINKPEILLKLMESISSFCSHNFMIPIVVQIILPMLKFESKPDLYAIAVRLLCKMWIKTDRVFANLQEVLDPKAISRFIYNREIIISIAASVRDVCKYNPDRGVDLILSVSWCIENKDSIVQSLGLEGLMYLCEADVVDFYTAWIVIEKHLLGYSLDPIIAYGLAKLLRWGAMDAEVYPDASRSVLQILWNIATTKRNIPLDSCSWVKARAEAFISLSHYKVLVIQEAIDEFKKRNFEFLVCEENSQVLKAMEELEIEIIKFEHTNRKRGQKDIRKTISKTEKLLDSFPQVIFSSDKTKYQDLPGASLLCFNFTPKIDPLLKTTKDLQRVNNAYEKALISLAESLYTSRNLIVAIICVQTWRSFVERWIETSVNFIKDFSSDILDKHTKAAKYILKILCRIAEESIPRVAMNIAFAICALCLVVPASAHFVVSDASEFLLNWLFEFGHEHKQWTAGICLGLITDCFHVTDNKSKFKVINSLHQVICTSESGLVKGACGAGLGFASKTLFKEINNFSKSEETDLLQTIITTLTALISKQCPFTTPLLKQFISKTKKNILEDSGISDEDPWYTAGLILGLGNSVFALYRSGDYKSIISIKQMLIIYIADKVFDEMSNIQIIIGACLALPVVISFCQRVDLSTNDDLDSLLNHYNSLISEILNINKSSAIYSDLLMAACIGAGKLISGILNDGVYNLKLEGVKNLIENIKSIYDNSNKNKSYNYSVQLGALFGVVNAFGASAGYINPQMEINSSVKGSIISNNSYETIYTEIVQEIFVLVKETEGTQRRQFCTWVLAFLRNQFIINNSGDKNPSINNNNNLSEDTLVWDLSSWLRDLDSINKEANIPKKEIISTILSCLSKAPKLPSFDWGIIIKRLMKYQDIYINKNCLNFSLIHANNINPLLNLLDDLTDLPRFKTLELNMQLFLLENISQLIKLFSGSRLDKLYNDLMQYFSLEMNYLLRQSFWRGICICFKDKDDDFWNNLEKLMECLIIKLPDLNNDNCEEEWFCAIECLSFASKTWLLDFLKVEEFDQGKKIVIISRLIRRKFLPISELGKIRAYILDAKDEGIWWRVLVEVSATISNSENNNIKQQWLLDALDISCVSNYPSTALKFVGLLSGFCCEFMPVLLINLNDVLFDLPITLCSLLKDPNWGSVRVSIAEKVWSTMNRVRTLNEHLMPGPVLEDDVLARVTYQTCVEIKEYLPVDKQIELASFDIL